MASDRCSSFAHQQLEKHGWKSGQGLGKTESGISEAIKVKIKQDTAGVGHDPGEQYTYHWWHHVFNKAASNIVVETDQDGVKLCRKSTKQGPISNKKWSGDRGMKPLLYGSFVKSATLTKAGLKPDNQDGASSSSDEDRDSPAATNIDERFYKACGGRTAHKGARHGLNSSGKLTRIQAQEEGHPQLHPPKGNNDVQRSAEGWEKKRRKKEKKCKSEENAAGVNTPCSGIVNADKNGMKPKICKNGAVEKGACDSHVYSTDDIQMAEAESKAARKATKKAKRTREKRCRQTKNTICADVKVWQEPETKEEIIYPHELTNGHPHNHEADTTRNRKQKKMSKHTAL